MTDINNVSICWVLLQRPQGLLCVLDEESQSLRPSEQTLYKRLSAQLDSSPTHGLSLTTKDGNGNPPPKDQGPAFTVSHYATQVCAYFIKKKQYNNLEPSRKYGLTDTY